MKRAIWPIVAIGAIFALGAVTALAVTDHAEQRAIVRAQACLRLPVWQTGRQAQASAATSITLFLLAVVLALVLATVGAVVAWHWWKERQKRERLREAMQQVQIYGAIRGQRLPLPAQAGARPGLPAQAGVRRVALGQPDIIVIRQPEHQATRWEVMEE